MPREALVPGAPPSKKKLVPEKGSDGLWHLTEVRHRAINGDYVRSSGKGETQDKCLEDFWKRYETNRTKGSVRRNRRSDKLKEVKFTVADKMSDVFGNFRDKQKTRWEDGDLSWKTFHNYELAIFPSERRASGRGAQPKADAIKLDTELGAYSIGEMGQTCELNGYIEDIADIAPGWAYIHHVILSSCFNTLTLQGLFPVSPMHPVPKPSRGGGTQRALKPAERSGFFQMLSNPARIPRGHGYVLPYAVTELATGVRPSEGLGFRWEDSPELDDDSIERAVIHVCGQTAKRPGIGTYRLDRRKAGDPYYVTLPKWGTSFLRAYKRLCAPIDQSALMFSLNGGPIAIHQAIYALSCIQDGSELDWMTWTNLRDTVATEVAGRTGEPKNASAQLGHSEGRSSVAMRHYVDQNGYKRLAVDNSEALEWLFPESDGNLTIFERIQDLVHA